ncbi:metal ABC transporter ATP-binding protein [Thermodesulfobacterium sp. TA1]|uniref:metal ABC transporter ATP-binding protein n=1 Tax=Thermodesulfobacterium sp. TA1 TaxID=2234087 RepID=UPI00123295AF|nr:metal ABC transporter ATP-binding protein [Thermodesulfobacterium sp. TA1]QER42328.1 metal ABC transporter ATP-binding protein [Thermodesulfobacterium sp. TA1]
MNQTVLKVENLYFAYDEALVLKDINFEVKQGDFLALIGPNGGGKSTLIKCILGFLKPIKGKVFWWNKELKDFKEWFKIGYVPQRAGDLIDFLTPLTVKEFLILPEKWYNKRLNPTYLAEVIHLFGLENLLNKKLGQLSYGQLQRAYIARALVLKPQVLILDEPSVGLDFFSQERFHNVLKDLHQKGLTILLITHETWLLTKSVNKIACINKNLFFHGSHEEFCVLSTQKDFYSDYHRIEHTHW